MLQPPFPVLQESYRKLDAACLAGQVASAGRLLDPGIHASVEGKTYARVAYLRHLVGLPESDGERSLGTRVRSVDVEGDTAHVVAVRRLVLHLRRLESPIEPNPLRRTDVWWDTWRHTPRGWRLVDRRETPLAIELRSMEDEDQRFRSLSFKPEDTATLAAMAKSDARHLARVKAILAARGWPRITDDGSEAATAMWLLVQHADAEVSFQKRCLDLMAAAVREGEAAAGDWAYLTDRVLAGEGKPQRYGTQFRLNDKGRPEPSPIEDPEHVEARRKALGMPSLADYQKAVEKAMANPS